MIYLVTGSNGSGKTLNSIKWVTEDSQFKNRPVYYFNIQGLNIPKSIGQTWYEISLEDAQNWMDLPNGAVIVLDEFYKVFPARPNTKTAPDFVQQLAEHRKDGYDFVLICQKPAGQFDSWIQGLVETHWHFERKYGSKGSTRYQWQKFNRDIDDYHKRKEAESTLIPFDKKIYDYYESAEIHTAKSRLPWGKFAIIASLPILLIVLMVFGFKALSGAKEEFSQAGNDSESGQVSSLVRGRNLSIGQSTADYIQDRQPRIDGVAFTAPVYDRVTPVRSAPKPHCYKYTHDDGNFFCKCVSQQATAMNVPENFCLSIVENGYFDHTIQDPEPWYDPLVFDGFGGSGSRSRRREGEGG